MTIALDRGADEGPTHLLMFLQLCCSIVEQHLLELFLLLQVKLGQLRGEVMTHHLKVVLCVRTVLARLGRGDEINHPTVITADKIRCVEAYWRVNLSMEEKKPLGQSHPAYFRRSSNSMYFVNKNIKWGRPRYKARLDPNPSPFNWTLTRHCSNPATVRADPGIPGPISHWC